MRKPFVGIVIALFAILVAGIAVVQGQGASTPTASATPGTCASPIAAPLATVSSSPAASAAAGVPALCASPVVAAGGVTLALEDIHFSVNEITIAANSQAVITIVNQGATVHNFNVDALNIHTGDLLPGATTSVTIKAKAGDYTYYCNIPAHEAAGMVGTLHIQ